MRIKTYNEEYLKLPKSGISLLGNFIPNYPVVYNVIYNSKDIDYKVRVTNGPGNVEYYRSEDGKVLRDAQGIPLCRVHDAIIGIGNSKIYKGDSKDFEIGDITTRLSNKGVKFSLEFFNTATQNIEILDINCDRFVCSCGIFQGNEKEGAPMISKITEIMDGNVFEYLTDYAQYYVEISPRVDNVLILSLVLFIIKQRHRYFYSRL